MSNVLTFSRKEPPHMSGEAICIGCRHTWAAVAPVGTTELECSECGTEKGRFRHAVSAMEGDSLFVCLCGCEALVAYYRKGQFRMQCMNCGVSHTDALFG